MVTKESIANAIEQYLQENNMFLVDITISKSDDIEVAVECSDKDVTIDNCVDIQNIVISSVLEKQDVDYSLTVTSAGLDNPFKVKQQYIKFLNSDVEVMPKGGGRVKGVLTKVEEESFEVTTSAMVKVEGAKKKVLQQTPNQFSYSDIKYCKPIIKFK